MSQHYLFPEPGSVPGVPGLFCGVRVDVADDGSFEVSPLAQHPHFEAAPVEEEAPPAEESVEGPLKGGELEAPTPIRKKQAKAPPAEEGN